MSDLENLQILKQMLENKSPSEKDEPVVREKRFFSAVIKAYLASTDNKMNGIQGYNPEEIVAFIKNSGSRLQSMLGDEWLDMDAMAFDALSYTVIQKIQKSVTLLDWK